MRIINEKEMNHVCGAATTGANGIDQLLNMEVISNIAGAIYGFGAGAVAGALGGGVAGGFATGGILGTAGGTLGYVFTLVWGGVAGAALGLIKGYEFTVNNIGNDAMFQNWMNLLNWDSANNNPVVS